MRHSHHGRKLLWWLFCWSDLNAEITDEALQVPRMSEADCRGLLHGACKDSEQAVREVRQEAGGEERIWQVVGEGQECLCSKEPAL